MKKLVLLLMLLLVCGCSSNEEIKEKEKILSTGELLCVYKEQRTNLNTMYTSSYQYNYNDNGILVDVIDREIVEFDDALDETKKYYHDVLNEAINDYKDVNGVEAIIETDDDKYALSVTMTVKDMDDKTKEDYLVTYDRINTYKLFTSMGYTCE